VEQKKVLQLFHALLFTSSAANGSVNPGGWRKNNHTVYIALANQQGRSMQKLERNSEVPSNRQSTCGSHHCLHNINFS
jgi:hypothetical protein